MMLKFRTLVACVIGFAAFLANAPQEAHARPLYQKVFKEMYPEKVEITKCALCHIGETKKVLNDYGKALDEALGAKNVKDVDAIKAALKKVEDKIPGKTK